MVLAVLGAAAGAVCQAAPAAAAAAAPTMPSLVAYVRSGNVYVSKGATEKRLTTGGGYARPRWSRDGRQLAVLKGGQLWVMKADGSAKRRLSTRPAAGASWSADGRWIAFASPSCTGGPGVYQISATAPGAAPQVLFPAECRGEALPAATAPAGPATGTLTERLRYDDAVAWSPDGARIAFRGGLCESIYDDCLTIGTVSTGAERTVAAYGGGSLETSGFAVLPSWRPDGARLAWTAYQQGETTADDQPVHVVEYDPATGVKRTVGAADDREPAYVDANQAVVTGQYRGGSWVLKVDLGTGTRTPFHAGSQPSVQPTAR
ncbi:hypothetical protein KRM28CT15_49830 [Krasilnikovia sp. M28-CT-15]